MKEINVMEVLDPTQIIGAILSLGCKALNDIPWVHGFSPLWESLEGGRYLVGVTI